MLAQLTKLKGKQNLQQKEIKNGLRLRNSKEYATFVMNPNGWVQKDLPFEETSQYKNQDKSRKLLKLSKLDS